jgi:16S rRNA C967 or C1407 C5-methylase (RsmB/RsmF family)/NOL1/NOP2/fmu family ribosome biogenesis protein
MDFHFPPAFESRMKLALNHEWEEFKEAHRAAAPVSIRLNPDRRIEYPGRQIPWCASGRYLEQRPVFTLDPFFHGGAYYVQEASSMFLEQAFLQHVAKDSILNILDLSAAPGGKSTHILSLVNPSGLLVANEVIRSRASILSENVVKWGHENCLVTNNDPSDFSALPGFFDVIVVDAPCSGEGLFRKDADAVKHWSEENVNHCALRQKRILTDVFRALKENGLLIYSTCTYNSLENETNLNDFCNDHAIEFLKIDLQPEWNVSVVEEGNVIGYRFMPHRTHGEGFFMSVMRKKYGGPNAGSLKNKRRLEYANKSASERLKPWLSEADALSYHQHNDLIFALRSEHLSTIEFLLGHLRFVYAGVNLARMKHDKLIPDHGLALSRLLDHRSLQHADLGLDESRKFLKKDPILLPGLEKGFTLIRYEGIGIGWANNLQQRVNNLYPQELMIRMALPK